MKERAGATPNVDAPGPGKLARARLHPSVGRTARPLFTLLSVSGSQDDHDTICRMIDSEWSVRQSLSVAAALSELRANRFAILLWDEDSFPGGWKDLQRNAAAGADAPYVVLTSRLADASLWAEALNLGAWDVLAKPLDAQEVARVLGVALTHWREQCCAWLSGPDLAASA